MSAHTPGPWLTSGAVVGILRTEVTGPDESRLVASVFTREYSDAKDEAGSNVVAWAEGVANLRLILAAPDLLALAHQYASECGDCAGTRVCPDDEPCDACADIWRVIDKAEGRA